MGEILKKEANICAVQCLGLDISNIARKEKMALRWISTAPADAIWVDLSKGSKSLHLAALCDNISWIGYFQERGKSREHQLLPFRS